MIKSKKRPADKALSNVEPLKKKTSVVKSKSNGATTPGTGKTSKFDKSNKKTSAVGKGKFVAKKPGSATNGKFVKSGSAPTTKGATNEKTDWRKFKQDKKDLKLKRKKGKDSYEISIEAKQIYEKLKCRKTEKKNELVEKLYNLLSADDIIRKLVMAHDTARVIQCMLKFASPQLREQISEKLLPLSVQMAVSKYSHFCVLRMFKYGSPNIKTKLVDSFFGHIIKLAAHSISNKILDHAYLTVANPKQKIYMRQEFYGDLYKNNKDNNVKELADTYKDNKEMKASILGSVKSNLEHIANKELVDNSLVHGVILEYLREIDEERIEETVTTFASLIPLLLTTKDGCQAATICFYKSTAKNRRAIVKTIKEHLVKICTHEHGHVFILALLESLDDTKAIKKAIFDTVHPEMETLMTSQYGRRVIEWFISPGNTNCFHPAFVSAIEEGNQYGKKDKDVRRKEIFEQIEEPIASSIADKPQFWFSNRQIALVTAEILKKVSLEHFIKAATPLAATIVDPNWKVTIEEEVKEKGSKPKQDIETIIAEATKLKKKMKQKSVVDSEEHSDDEKSEDKAESNSETVSGIEEAGMHVVLKKIIKNDKERLGQNADTDTFGSLVVQHLTDETLEYWLIVNRACFVLLNIVENNNESTKKALKKLLESHQDALSKQKAAGAQLLLKKITS